MRCVVNGCKNKGRKRLPGVSFHKFPKHEIMRQRWLNAIGKPDFITNSHTLICSEHFRIEDIFQCRERTKLKNEAVPELKLNQDTCADLKEYVAPTVAEYNIYSDTEDNGQMDAINSITVETLNTAHIQKLSWNNDEEPETAIVNGVSDTIDNMLVDTINSEDNYITNENAESIIEEVRNLKQQVHLARMNFVAIRRTNENEIKKLRNKVSSLKLKIVDKNKFIKTLKEQIRRRDIKIVNLANNGFANMKKRTLIVKEIEESSEEDLEPEYLEDELVESE